MTDTNDTPSLRRRQLVAGSGVALAGILAGCFGSSDDSSDPDGDTNETSSPPAQDGLEDREIPDASDRQRWVRDILDAPELQLPITAESVYVPMNGRHRDRNAELVAFALADGTEQWRIETEADTILNGPVVTDDAIYYSVSDELVYIGLDDHSVRWRAKFSEFVADDATMLVPAGETISVIDDTVTMTVSWLDDESPDDFMDDGFGAVLAFDANTGDLRWQHETTNAFQSGTVEHDGTVYAASDTLVALDLHSGTLQWDRELKSHASFTPLVDADGIYVADEDTFRGVDPETGDQTWSIDLSKPVSHRHRPAFDDERVYIAMPEYEHSESDERHVAAVARDNGEIIWDVLVEHDDGSRLQLARQSNRLVIAGSRLTEHDTDTGERLWTYTDGTPNTGPYTQFSIGTDAIGVVDWSREVHVIEAADLQ